MRHQRRWVAFVAVVLLVTGGGCGLGRLDVAAAAEQAGFPVTIENCGRTLTFDKPPSRVIAYVGNLDLLIELGVADRVIGRTRLHEDLSTLPPQWVDEYEAIPEVTDGSRIPVKEELLALEPDFVFPSYYVDFDSTNGFATREELAAAGIQSYLPGNQCDVASDKAFKLDYVFDDVRNMGKIFGVEDRAAQVLADLQARVADVERRVAGRPPVRVMVADTTEEAFYAPGGGIYEEVVERAGGTNIFGYGEDGYAQVSVEEVAAANADAYVVLLYRPDTPEQRIARIEAIAPFSPGVLNKRYALVQNNELTQCIRTVYGIEKIAKALHPDAFS